MAKSHEVNKGDIILDGSTFFLVTDIRESMRLADALVFRVDMYSHDRQMWVTRPTGIMAYPFREWNVLSPEAVEMAGFTTI